MTFDRLVTLRRDFAAFVLGLGALFVCMCGFLGILVSPTELQGLGNRAALYPGSLTLLVPRFLIAGVVYVFSTRINIPNRWAYVFVSFFPLGTWISFYQVVGYTPEHLKAEQEAHDIKFAPFPYWVIPSALPLFLMGGLAVLNPNYMGQLVFGPPIGANIPGIPIPCGWPILAAIILLMAVGDLIMWVAFKRRLVRGVWLVFLTLQVMVVFAFPAVWLGIFGPAVVQMYKAFMLNQ